MGGAYADALLTAGTTYTIFYHYRNLSRTGGPLVIALHGTNPGPLKFSARKGMADPQRDPPLAGRQAMARFLQAGENAFVGKKGTAHFSSTLKNGQVASGILTVKCEKNGPPADLLSAQQMDGSRRGRGCGCRPAQAN